MQLTVFVTALLASVASARTFVLYEHANYGGAWSTENRGNDGTCWNLNGKGDKTSSVGGDSGCTTFYRQGAGLSRCTMAEPWQREDGSRLPQ
nr:uncharacterized protein CTRU02_02015 [Colletotrichum truncatum]KAF6799144.1 hypothetical protein CTRU02_02015 [Colletotrichum truncatum]